MAIYRPWTKYEEIDLKRNYGKVDVEEIAEQLQRSVPAVKTRAWHLGLCPKQKKLFVLDSELIALRKQGFTYGELSKKLGIHKSTIKTRVRNIGINNESLRKHTSDETDSQLQDQVQVA